VTISEAPPPNGQAEAPHTVIAMPDQKEKERRLGGENRRGKAAPGTVGIGYMAGTLTLSDNFRKLNELSRIIIAASSPRRVEARLQPVKAVPSAIATSRAQR
jgi:hypothetical protein